MLDQNHPLSKYEEAFRENSLAFSSFNVNREDNTMSILNGYEDILNGNITIDLSFKTGNSKVQNPDTLFYLMMDALFYERYGMRVKEFENMYPEIVI